MAAGSANGELGGHSETAAAKSRTAAGKSPPVTLTGLFGEWWREAQAAGRKPSTHESYQNTVKSLAAFLKHDDAQRITAEDIVAFKDYRLTTPSPRTGKPPSPKTVKDSDLSALKTLFGWAVMNRKLPANPAAGLTIKVGRRAQVRPKGFVDSEARAILSAATAYSAGPREHPKTAAAKRWIPWLCACSGARVGEIGQLRREDVRFEMDRWVIIITPEAGTVKTNHAREIVLHHQLAQSGFPEFVKSSKDGPLFLVPTPDGVCTIAVRPAMPIDRSHRLGLRKRDRERTPSCRNGPTSTDTDRQPWVLARRRHILPQSHLIGAFGPLLRFWSKSTMPAETAAVRKTVANGAGDTLPALIVLGLDDSGKAHASWFDDDEADTARSAASLMGMRSLTADTEALQTIAARLPHGRIFPSGKAFVPFVKAAVYEQLAGMLPKGEAGPLRLVPGSKGKAADQAKGVARGAAKASAVGAGSGGRGGATGDAGASSGSDDRPADWQKLKAGSVVLITEGDQEGWFEAVIVQDKGDGAYTLKWRDWPEEPTQVRRRHQIALLPPVAT
nr:phage integrase N-terminal SAM-like domain-containing protein [Aureimonas altamirensis]